MTSTGSSRSHFSTPSMNAGSDLGQVLLGQIDGPGVDVDHPEAGLYVDHLGHLVVAAPHEHAALDPGLAQGGDQLPDVDVHASAVTRARLGEG